MEIAEELNKYAGLIDQERNIKDNIQPSISSKKRNVIDEYKFFREMLEEEFSLRYFTELLDASSDLGVAVDCDRRDIFNAEFSHRDAIQNFCSEIPSKKEIDDLIEAGVSANDYNELCQFEQSAYQLYKNCLLNPKNYLSLKNNCLFVDESNEWDFWEDFISSESKIFDRLNEGTSKNKLKLSKIKRIKDHSTTRSELNEEEAFKKVCKENGADKDYIWHSTKGMIACFLIYSISLIVILAMIVLAILAPNWGERGLVVPFIMISVVLSFVSIGVGGWIFKNSIGYEHSWWYGLKYIILPIYIMIIHSKNIRARNHIREEIKEKSDAIKEQNLKIQEENLKIDEENLNILKQNKIYHIENLKTVYAWHDPIIAFLDTFKNDLFARVKEENKLIAAHNEPLEKEYEKYENALSDIKKAKSECTYANKAWNILLKSDVISPKTDGQSFLDLFDNYIVKNEYDLINAANDLIEKKKRRDFEYEQNRLLEQANQEQQEANRRQQEANRRREMALQEQQEETRRWREKQERMQEERDREQEEANRKREEAIRNQTSAMLDAQIAKLEADLHRAIQQGADYQTQNYYQGQIDELRRQQRKL